jgi:predicted DCC family thiol-disulfide oxidoreductase YuxK
MDESGRHSSHQVTHSPIYQLQSVILFDGVCNLCSGFVRFVIARDPGGRFRFASLQSDVARQLLKSRLAGAGVPDSIVLVDGARVFTRSAAALRIFRGLRFPWPLLSAFLAVPRPIRDFVYDVVAKRRYRWFGRQDVCMIPTPELQARFVTD